MPVNYFVTLYVFIGWIYKCLFKRCKYNNES